METLRGQKKRRTEPFSVRNKQGASGLTQGQEGRKKRKIPAFLTCCHGIKQQQKGPLLPRLNLLRVCVCVCARENRVFYDLGQIFFSSRYILFSSLALPGRIQTSADTSVACKRAHVGLHARSFRCCRVIYGGENKIAEARPTRTGTLGSMETGIKYPGTRVRELQPRITKQNKKKSGALRNKWPKAKAVWRM